MKKDLDMELYNKYLDGENEAFELLYNKYKNKIQYFIFNIVKDYQKAEDLTQEVFAYILENKVRDNYSFKYYIYLVAKSRALNYINTEKRRNKINEKYFEINNEKIENDVLDMMIKMETKEKLLEAINELDEKYRNALYLIKIEELSYEETSNILGESLSNTKVLIHRGKIKLRTIIMKKGLIEMNKMSKIILLILCISVILSGVSYAVVKLYQKYKQNIKMTPTYTSEISSIDTNKVWVRNIQSSLE